MIFAPQVKLLLHSDKLNRWVINGRTYPILAEVAPVGYCNANCPWCFFKTKKSKKKINTRIMLEAIADMAYSGLEAINWSGGGEPTLHPDLDKFIVEASRRGIKQGIFTNGYKVIPHQDKFEWIRISLTDKGFKVIKKPKVPFGICVNHIWDHDKDMLDSLCLASKNFGASYFQIRPALIGSHKTQPTLFIPEYLKKYETRKFKVYVTDYKYKKSTEPKDYKHCYGYHFCLSIDWNEKVSACLYMAHKKEFILGDLKKARFPFIWSSIPEKINVVKDCQNCCKNHEINMLLYKARHVESIEFL